MGAHARNYALDRSTKVPVQFWRTGRAIAYAERVDLQALCAEMADTNDVTVSVTVAPEFDNGDKEGNVFPHSQVFIANYDIHSMTNLCLDVQTVAYA